MATRSTIGYETPDGGYVGVYCHYDGFPDHMGPILHRMFHADVVILVSKALAKGGIRCLNDDGTYEIFNDAPVHGLKAETEWPCCPEQFAYRKCLDGRVEWTDDAGGWSTWEPNVP
jgi:hypothetical protein